MHSAAIMFTYAGTDPQGLMAFEMRDAQKAPLFLYPLGLDKLMLKLPGLIDPHVHLCKPCTSHKEDFDTGVPAEHYRYRRKNIHQLAQNLSAPRAARNLVEVDEAG